MNSLIYSFSVYLFNTYSVLVDSKDTVMSKTQPVSLFTEHLFWKRKADKKKTKYDMLYCDNCHEEKERNVIGTETG